MNPIVAAGLTEAPDILRELDNDWHTWTWGQTVALIRRLDEDRYVAVVPFIFTWGLIVGPLDCFVIHDDRWCYHGLWPAVAAANVWDGTGDPVGWHRHPGTGRRRPDGDPGREYVEP